ncbi:MAG: dihydropteroate synthase [Pseudomonadota bacterium]
MFKIIGELINTTRKKVKEAAEARDAAFIRDLAERQVRAGAAFIDVNGGGRAGHELETMSWLLDVVQEASGDVPLSLDSNDPAVLRLACEKVLVTPLINSISLETGRWNGLSSFLNGRDCDVLALCLDDSGLPKTLRDILDRAEKLIHGLNELGFPNHRIYIDPLIQPIATDATKGRTVMTAVTSIMEMFPGVHTCCGLSNISFGLPQRRVVNRYFLALMISAGLDSAILDPLDGKMMEAVWTSEMLVGRDRFCRNYLGAARAGGIEA